jgi:hypothetical protein
MLKLCCPTQWDCGKTAQSCLNHKLLTLSKQVGYQVY